MRKSSKIISAAAIAVLAAAGGTAFTATGLDITGQAASAQFIGGTVTQGVTGATLKDILYGYGTDDTQKSIKSVMPVMRNVNTGGTKQKFHIRAVSVAAARVGPRPTNMASTTTLSR